MSYILNALRKSERERQAIEPDTVTNRIIVQQPARHNNTPKLIAALVLLNLGILVYFLGFTQKTPPVPMQTESVLVKPEVPPAAMASRLPVVTSTTASKKPSIADIIETAGPASTTSLPDNPPAARKQLIKSNKPAVAPPQPAEPTKQVAIKPELTPKKQIESVKAAIAAPQPVVQAVVLAKDVIEKTAPIQMKNNFPFLEELPIEVSRSLPNLPINVFSYSAIPAERFVLIDMVKYVPGQRIKNQLELKEIREDYIVVSYEDRTFKIRRP